MEVTSIHATTILAPPATTTIELAEVSTSVLTPDSTLPFTRHFLDGFIT
jgi:hypothetical protein